MSMSPAFILKRIVHILFFLVVQLVFNNVYFFNMYCITLIEVECIVHINI